MQYNFFGNVINKITYTPDSKYNIFCQEHWQYPKETISKGTGDCEDMAILLMNILKILGVKSYLAIGTLQQSIYQRPQGHAWVLFNYKGYNYSFEATAKANHIHSLGLEPHSYKVNHILTFKQAIEEIQYRRCYS